MRRIVLMTLVFLLIFFFVGFAGMACKMEQIYIYWIEQRYNENTLDETGRFIIEYQTHTGTIREWECPFPDGRFLAGGNDVGLLLAHNEGTKVIVYRWMNGKLLQFVGEINDDYSIFGYNDGFLCYKEQFIYRLNETGTSEVEVMELHNNSPFDWRCRPSISEEGVICYALCEHKPYGWEYAINSRNRNVLSIDMLEESERMGKVYTMPTTVWIDDDTVLGFILRDIDYAAGTALLGVIETSLPKEDTDKSKVTFHIMTINKPCWIGGYSCVIGKSNLVGLYTNSLWYSEYFLNEISVLDISCGSITTIKQYDYGPWRVIEDSAIITLVDIDDA